MTSFIDESRGRAVARRMAKAARDLADARAKLNSHGSLQGSLQGGAPDYRAEEERRRSQEAATRAEEEHRKAREEAQRYLSDIRRAMSSGRQDLGVLERGASELRSGGEGFRSGAAARREDLQRLQSLERELQNALQTPSGGGESAGGFGPGTSPWLTEGGFGSGWSAAPSSSSLSAIEEAVAASTRPADGLEGMVRSGSAKSQGPRSPSRDFDPYAISDDRRYQLLWPHPGAAAEEAREREVAEQYYYYRKHHPLTARATYAREQVQSSIGALNDGGRGYRGQYGG